MVCENCDPELNKPGRVVKIDGHFPDIFCAECGRDLKLSDVQDMNRTSDKVIPGRLINAKEYKLVSKTWDIYFHHLCTAVASKSPCLSRKIGAILVRDHSVVSTGYNGPPRGIPHCGHERIMKDESLKILTLNYPTNKSEELPHPSRWANECPRHVLGYTSGTHMELCPTVHAEANAIVDAGRKGASTIDTTLYMNSVIPCQKCYGLLINAGIKEIVIEKAEPYDKHCQFQIDNSKILIREFEL